MNKRVGSQEYDPSSKEYWGPKANEKKEAYAIACLQAELHRLRFFVARPLPDLGDDLWVLPYPDTATATLPVRRIQVKSMFSRKHIRPGVWRYSANIREESYDLNIRPDKFYVFVQIHVDNGVVAPANFVCVPSVVLAKCKMRRTDSSDPRLMVEINHHETDGSYSLYLRDCDVSLENCYDLKQILTHPNPAELILRKLESPGRRGPYKKRQKLPQSTDLSVSS